MTKTGWTGIFREVVIEQQSVCFNSWFSKDQNGEIHVRSVILGKRNRSPSIPPVFWLNLCSQLLLSFENDQIKVFEISELPEVKIRRIPRQIFKNPAWAPLSPDQAWNISRAQLSTPSELGERAFQRGSQKGRNMEKKIVGWDFSISRLDSYIDIDTMISVCLFRGRLRPVTPPQRIFLKVGRSWDQFEVSFAGSVDRGPRREPSEKVR